MKKAVFLFLGLFLVLYLSAYAPVLEFPKEINYQGMLTTPLGSPVPDGSYSIKFTIWSHETSTSASYKKWEHTYSPVTVTNGLFNVRLGEGAPINLPFTEEYWLEIQVGADPALSPRTKLTAVGYAYRSLVADYATSAGGGGWVDDGANVRLETIGDEVGIGTTSPNYKLDGRSSIGIGSSSESGLLELYQAGASDPVIEASPDGSMGGLIRLYDEANNIMISAEADGNGEGGWFGVRRSTSSYGFTVDANYGGTKDPYVNIDGSSRDAIFNMSLSGNSSVQLPSDAIYDYEILDEPGVASNKDGSSQVTLTGATQTLLSRTITCPSSGYVLVIGTAQPQFNHVKGTSTGGTFGVSTSSSSFPVNQDVLVAIPSSAEDGTYYSAVTVHGLFSVSSGNNTFYFLADKYSGGTVYVFDMQLTLAYFPTAYGGVVSTKIAGEPDVPDDQALEAPAITDADVTAEQAEAEAFNTARLERELAEIRARVEALEQEQEGQDQ